MADTWRRLEVNTRSEAVEPGLQARIADPFWMLARQWQTGEFRGEDAASPVLTELTFGSTKLQTFAPGSLPEMARKLPTDRPLEMLVEQEPVLNGPAAFRLASDAGLHFLRLLDAQDAGELREIFREAFPLSTPDHDLSTAADRRNMQMRARRSIDGLALFRHRRRLDSRLPGGVSIPASLRSRVAAARDIWIDWYKNRVQEPEQGMSSWNEQRMEYGFSVAAPAKSESVTLTSDEYHGGHLDWYAFDVETDNNKTHKLASAPLARETLRKIPTPVHYKGMPASRWWAFEDREVNFGAIGAGPADMARLIVAEFATVYSDDWYVFPVEQAIGTISRIESLTVTDTFGDTHPIRSTAENDGKHRVWKFFELENDDSAEKDLAPWFFLPPTLITSLNGERLEQIMLVRDEGANLAWAVERQVENPLGQAHARLGDWAPEADTEESAGDFDAWTYQLATRVPPHWIPFVPERSDSSSAMRLRRGRMQQWELLSENIAGVKGSILLPDQPLILFEEEVPRGGAEISRAYQMSRWLDGTLHIWMARQKRPGGGEKSSGLKFDLIKK